MAAFVDLESLIGAPLFVPPAVDWDELERATLFSFPDDYKRLFEKYPHLQFDGFLGVFHPGDDIAGFIKGTRTALEPLRVLAANRGSMTSVDASGEREDISPYPIFPEAGGLFHWGGTENGDSCLWLTSGQNMADWPIVVTDGIDYWRYDEGLVNFLIGVMHRTVRCPLFPADFPSSFRVDQFDARRPSS
ncbi:hypothetical protein [Actinomadura sp. 3N407]|uniref:hypothetical protein n=1 Tax=Actinomadura sp. 3N407 TaxID=3457423 RepID=UPI003FCE11E5